MKSENKIDLEELLEVLFADPYRFDDFDEEMEKDKFGLKDELEQLIDETRMYYNPSKKAFTIIDTVDVTNKSIVKKHPEDIDDMEKAMLYCLFKYLGVSPAFLNKQLKKVNYQDIPKQSKAEK